MLHESGDITSLSLDELETPCLPSLSRHPRASIPQVGSPEGLAVGASPLGYARGVRDQSDPSGFAEEFMMTFATIAEREDAPVLLMIRRRKAFTVLGRMLMRFAIVLLSNPCSKYSSTSCSRCVRLNFRDTLDRETNPEGPRSSKTAVLGSNMPCASEFS